MFWHEIPILFATDMVGKCPDVSLKIPSFVSTNTAGKCPNDLLKISGFVTYKTAAKRLFKNTSLYHHKDGCKMSQCLIKKTLSFSPLRWLENVSTIATPGLQR